MVDSLISTYVSFFINRKDVWFKQGFDSHGKFRYLCQKPGEGKYEPVTLTLINKHIAGIITASWPAINTDGMSKWCCWDADTDMGDLERVENVLFGWGLKTLREGRRPGRAGHLWLLLREALPAADLIRFNREVLAHARVPNNAIEFFPKSSTGLSQVRGPLGVHRKLGADNQRGWFEGPERTVENQLEWLAAQPLNDITGIGRMVNALRQIDKQKLANYPLSLPLLRRQPGRRIPVLELVPNRKRIGNGWTAPCPACLIEGHDRHQDNLRISLDGSKFCCVYGGPAQVHKSADIIRLLTNGLG